MPARRLEREHGDNIDPVVAQMASYFACLRSSARFALLRTSLRGSFLWAQLVAKGSTVDEVLVGDPHRVGDVTSRSQFRAAGLSAMVVTPGEEDVCLACRPSGKGWGPWSLLVIAPRQSP